MTGAATLVEYAVQSGLREWPSRRADGITRWLEPNESAAVRTVPPKGFDASAVSRRLGALTVSAFPLDQAAPWLTRQLGYVEKTKSLSAEWIASGANPPNDTARELAERVLWALSEADFEPEHVDPSTGEGICVSFRQDDRYADIECFNDGDILAVTATDNEKPNVWEVLEGALPEAVRRITSFING